MSSRTESSTAILRVKGVSFNYLQFLWKNLNEINEARQQGNTAVALKLCIDLCDTLPRSLKKEFRLKAIGINHSMLQIRSCSLPELARINDLHKRHRTRNWLLTSYSTAALSQFLDQLTTKLDEMGYMENTKITSEGDADGVDGDGTWKTNYEQSKDRGKIKPAKKDKAPAGSMS